MEIIDHHQCHCHGSLGLGIAGIGGRRVWNGFNWKYVWMRMSIVFHRPYVERRVWSARKKKEKSWANAKMFFIQLNTSVSPLFFNQWNGVRMKIVHLKFWTASCCSNVALDCFPLHTPYGTTYSWLWPRQRHWFPRKCVWVSMLSVVCVSLLRSLWTFSLSHILTLHVIANIMRLNIE